MFAFLDAVRPGGGGMVAVAGSHRLTEDMKRIGSQMVKRRLDREPYFRELMSKDHRERARFTTEWCRVAGSQLRVVELSGEPGDVVLWT